MTDERRPASELRLATGVSADFLDSLGAIVVNFAALEHAVSLCIWLLLSDLGLPSGTTTQVVTASLSFKNLQIMCAGLFVARFGEQDPDRESLMGMLSECGRAEERRNALIHSLWVAGYPGDEPQADRLKIISRLKHFEIQGESVKRSDLIAAANWFADLDIRLRQFMPTKLHGSPSALEDLRRQSPQQGGR